MRHLGLRGLYLVLSDLLTNRVGALRLLAAAATYEALLRTRLTTLEGMPEVVNGRTHVEQLDEADADHDGFGTAVWYLTEAILRCPSTTKEIAEAALRVRTEFFPVLGDANARFPVEAAIAKARAAKVEPLRADMEKMPVPGGTVLQWVQGYLSAGERLDKLLSTRSDTEANSKRDGAATLRNSTVGVLGRLRETVRDELEANPKLPRDLETQLFAYIDQMAKESAPTKRNPSPSKA